MGVHFFLVGNPVAWGRPKSPSHGAFKRGNSCISVAVLLVVMPLAGVLCHCFSKSEDESVKISIPK